MVASRNELKWYDLEAKHQEPPSSILVFDATPYRMMAGLKGLSYQENANNEGENIFYVAFVGWPNTYVLRTGMLYFVDQMINPQGHSQTELFDFKSHSHSRR